MDNPVISRILFLCTGNFYRSRFAEIYFNEQVKHHHPDISAFSRGFEVFAARNSGPLSLHTNTFLEHLNIPLPVPLSFPVQLEDSDFEVADFTIALDHAEHLPMLRKYFPHRESEVEFWSFADVQFAAPEQVLPALKKQLDDFLECFI
ncbi:MAG: low molecular weight phosphatase family protein [Bacteroidetes bacterium]|nr:MAG: low molecular weight phosphatase family protein [Bacteroidota bacterium]